MLPTFNTEGDLLIVDKLSPRWIPYRKNDIIAARSPDRDGQGVCKRIRGVAGDVITSGSHSFKVCGPRLSVVAPPVHVGCCEGRFHLATCG